MAYAVKEMFLTLQGEGAHSGRTAVFLRFTGCNLWNGLENGRATGTGECARWCDTDFVGMNGTGGGRFGTSAELAQAVERLWGDRKGQRYVVCTGGEPLLQLDDALVESLHGVGFQVAVETNGTQVPPAGLDWICVSPKGGTELVLKQGNELKLVFPQQSLRPEQFEGLPFDHFFLQPMDGPARSQNVSASVEYCLSHPTWRLSLQTHKWIGIP